MNSNALQPVAVDQYRINAARLVADRALTFLQREDALRLERRRGPAFVVWPNPTRAILIFDPLIVNGAKVSKPDFAQRLAEHLHRRAVVSNGSYLFIQVAYTPGLAHLEPAALPDRVPLDLTTRPSGRLMLPLGISHRGPLWLSLLDMDSVLIGGTRRMGKTTLLHTWLLALVTGKPAERVRLILFDGKDGIEFGRYTGLRHVETVARSGAELANVLGNLRGELSQRSRLLRQNNVRNVAELPVDVRPPYLVLVVDELASALETVGVDAALRDLVSRGGAYGILPVLATQRPESAVVSGFLKCNLATRISLPVPDLADSKVILGRAGAEKLPRIQGRILFVWEGRRVEAQAFDAPTAMIEDVLGRLRQGQAPLKPPLALEDWEKRLVEIALREPFCGAFPYQEIARAAGVSHRQVEALARRWELEGLLTPAHYEGGRKFPRRMTEQLRALAVV